MRFLFPAIALALMSLLPVTASADDKLKEVFKTAKYMQNVAVTVRAGSYSGSGTIVQTKDGSIYIWTAAHVCAPLRETRKVIDDKGGTRTKVEFQDAKIMRYFKDQKEGRIVASYSGDAEIIRYSDSEFGHDLCLLRLRDKPTREFNNETTAKFYLDDSLPDIGDDLLHCGSLLGPIGSNSLTSGILSQHGRVFDGKIYDQTNCTAFPGSSGGIVALKGDGRYIGMLVAGAGEGFNIIVPARRIRAWAKAVGVEFALDAAKEVPKDEVLKAKPIEDSESSSGDHKDHHGYKHRLEAKFKLWLHEEGKEPKEEKGIDLEAFLKAIKAR